MALRPADPAARRRLLAMMVGMAAAAALGWLVAARQSATEDSSAVAAPDQPTETTLAPVGTTQSSATAEPPATSVEEPDGADLERDGIYRWLWADPADVRVVWQDENGEPYNQLQRARVALEEAGEPVVAIMNGGIYRPDLVPSGLHVENGVELRPLNRDSGSGNFFLQPNGVFWIDGGEAGVDTTDRYANERAGAVTIDYAVQSGPMLLVDSTINDKFSETSTSTFRRNAVGVDADGRVLLIMADRPVTLWEMASRCRELGAVDALYLDGSVSRFEFVADGRSIFFNVPVASMIAVVADGDEAAGR